MDDTLVVFSNENAFGLFVHSLNSLTLSLCSVLGKESNLALPFLDVLVEKSSFKFIISIYRKPTFLGEYLRWNYFSPQKRKTFVKTSNPAFCRQKRIRVQLKDCAIMTLSHWSAFASQSLLGFSLKTAAFFLRYPF